MKKLFYLSMITTLLLSACNLSKQYLKNGQYDMAVKTAVRKLQRNKSKTKQLEVLKQAYPKAVEKDMDQIKYLNEEGQANRWDKIFHIYKNMKDRQSIVEKLYPLYLNGKLLKFQHINLDKKIQEAKTKAATYYFVNGKLLMAKNNKFAYRQAYEDFLKVKAYSNAYKEIDKLIKTCYIKGLSHILLIAVNSSPENLPNDFMINLIDFPLNKLDSKWIIYHKKKYKNYIYDVYINIVVTNVVVSPNQQSVRNYTETKKITDGWEYKLDKNGKKITDSNGVAIKVEKYKTISCYIKEYRQYKTAYIDGVINYTDGQSRETILSIPIKAEHNFENYYIKAKGDLNALSKETKSMLGNAPVDYPDDIDMIYAANSTLKQAIYNALMDKRAFIIQKY
jgi:hypothetical protein